MCRRLGLPMVSFDDDDVGEGGYQINGSESAVGAKHATSLLSADEFERLEQLNEDEKKSFEEQSDSGSSLASDAEQQQQQQQPVLGRAFFVSSTIDDAGAQWVGADIDLTSRPGGVSVGRDWQMVCAAACFSAQGGAVA